MNATQHPLKQAFTAKGYPWLLAQTYAALGLGTSGDKMKGFRSNLQQGQDWLEYRDPAQNNSKRICYTQSGIQAIAQKLNTPKALEFARLVSSHRADNADAGAIVIAQPQAVTPVDTTYRMARVDDGGELQRLEPKASPLQASDWHVDDNSGGELARVDQPFNPNLLGFQGLRVGMPKRVGGSVIINQGTINYTVQTSEGRSLPTISRQTWERVSIGLLFTCIAVPVFFLSLYINSAISSPRNNHASDVPYTSELTALPSKGLAGST
jgi:hypothetical protein